MARRHPSPVVPAILVISITIVLAALLYTMVGGCYYSSASVTLAWGSVDARPDRFASSIQNWSRTTKVSYNATLQTAVYFDFACNGKAGHGKADFTPSSGGPNTTVEVVMYMSSDRPLPYDDPGVDESFSRDRARLEPCVEELTTILSAPIGRTPDSISWNKWGLC